MSNTDYLDFLSGILLFRTVRDMDNFPDTWLEREIALIGTGGYSAEEAGELLLTAKVAELLDGSKQWLLDEVNEDIYQITNPGCVRAEIEFPEPGCGWDWWADEFTVLDDMGNPLGLGYDEHARMIWVSASIKAEDAEMARCILRERIESFLQAELPAVA